MVLCPLMLRYQQSFQGLPVLVLFSARFQDPDRAVSAGMECDMANRKTNLTRHLSHPLFDHWIKQGTGFARGIKKLHKVHLGTWVANSWRMFARAGCLSRCGVSLQRLSVVTFVQELRCHEAKRQNRDGNSDETRSTAVVLRVHSRWPSDGKGRVRINTAAALKTTI